MAGIPTQIVNIPDLNAFYRSRSFLHHADRSSARFQVFYSAPMRKWIRVSRANPTQAKVEYFDTCPCSLGG